MIEIQGILVDESVFRTKFSCDYEKCHGACCWKSTTVDTMGGALLDDEAEEIESKIASLLDFVPEQFRETAKKNPVICECEWYTTPLKDGACVYCSLTKKTCVLKQANASGVLSFGIPVHCHLYPLVSEIKDDEHIFYVSSLWDEFCKGGYEKGERENVPIIHFCKEAIIRMYGEEFYEELEQKRLEYVSSVDDSVAQR